MSVKITKITSIEYKTKVSHEKWLTIDLSTVKLGHSGSKVLKGSKLDHFHADKLLEYLQRRTFVELSMDIHEGLHFETVNNEHRLSKETQVKMSGVLRHPAKCDISKIRCYAGNDTFLSQNTELIVQGPTTSHFDNIKLSLIDFEPMEFLKITKFMERVYAERVKASSFTMMPDRAYAPMTIYQNPKTKLYCVDPAAFARMEKACHLITSRSLSGGSTKHIR